MVFVAAVADPGKDAFFRPSISLTLGTRDCIRSKQNLRHVALKQVQQIHLLEREALQLVFDREVHIRMKQAGSGSCMGAFLHPSDSDIYEGAPFATVGTM